MPPYRTLLFEVDRGVATITLNRPAQRNAVGDGMRDELADAPMSVAASKRLLWDSFDLDREAVGARETDIHLQLMGHEDAREGVRAHLQRRPPRWTGTPRDPTV
jgi:enoyl-CoA hydratase/carnithine racemase